MISFYELVRKVPEITDSLHALSRKTENKSVFPLLISFGTSLLCVALLECRDKTSLKVVPREKKSKENLLLPPKASFIFFMHGWFLYFSIALLTRFLFNLESEPEYQAL